MPGVKRSLTAVAASHHEKSKKPCQPTQNIHAQTTSQAAALLATSDSIRAHKTSVSNVKVSYIRPKYDNLENWIKDPQNVYIGRKGIVFIRGERFPKENSIWANPFKVGRDGNIGSCLAQFEAHIRKKIENENLNEQLKTLNGRNMGCWCVSKMVHCNEVGIPMVCHGQVLLKLLKEQEEAPPNVTL